MFNFKFKLKDILNLNSVFLNSPRKSVSFSKEAAVSACFSGYRCDKLKKEGIILNTEKYDDFLFVLEENIKRAIDDGYTRFYNGGCDGFDIIAGEIVLNLKKQNKDIKLITVIPFEKQSEKFSFEWKQRYNNILDLSDRCITLQEHFTRNCYQRRNEYMANRSSRLICYFTGESGGTKNTFNYCKKIGLDIDNIADSLQGK